MNNEENNNADNDNTNDNVANQMNTQNQNLNNLIRRAMNTQVRLDEADYMTTRFLNLRREFKQIIFSKKCFLFSSILSIILITCLYFTIRRMDITIASLESDEMGYVYLLLFSIIMLFTWNFYLLIIHVFLKFEYSKMKTNDILTADILYFNPLLFTLMIFYFNRSYVRTSFDSFAWMIISSQYFINFYYTAQLYKYANKKISQITNLMLEDNTYILYRIRLSYFFLCAVNILLTYTLKVVIDDTDFMYKYFILLKVC